MLCLGLSKGLLATLGIEEMMLLIRNTSLMVSRTSETDIREFSPHKESYFLTEKGLYEDIIQSFKNLEGTRYLFSLEEVERVQYFK